MFNKSCSRLTIEIEIYTLFWEKRKCTNSVYCLWLGLNIYLLSISFSSLLKEKFYKKCNKLYLNHNILRFSNTKLLHSKSGTKISKKKMKKQIPSKKFKRYAIQF